MNNFLAFLLILAIVLTDASITRDISKNKIHRLHHSDHDTEIEVKTIDDIEGFIKAHPGTHVEQLKSASNVKGIINYTLGARLPGDKIVATGARNQSWPAPQNVALTLTYPSQGVGAQLTYIFISVNQSTNLGQAYVVRGGLHQRLISIVVEAYNTVYCNYIAQFYGFP